MRIRSRFEVLIRWHLKIASLRYDAMFAAGAVDAMTTQLSRFGITAAITFRDSSQQYDGDLRRYALKL